jgi:hypothetical protein
MRYQADISVLEFSLTLSSTSDFCLDIYGHFSTFTPQLKHLRCCERNLHSKSTSFSSAGLHLQLWGREVHVVGHHYALQSINGLRFYKEMGSVVCHSIYTITNR